MNGKTTIVASWGALLILVHGWQDGDFKELFAIIASPKAESPASVSQPGFILRFVGQVAFIVVLALLTEYSDDGGNLALAILLGISLLLAVNNGSMLAGLSKFIG